MFSRVDFELRQDALYKLVKEACRALISSYEYPWFKNKNITMLYGIEYLPSH